MIRNTVFILVWTLWIWQKISAVPLVVIDAVPKKQFYDNWNYKAERRSYVSILASTIKKHNLPPPANSTSTPLWEVDQQKDSSSPKFFDKILQLLNLKEFSSEIQSSVTSKATCTACNAGVGLLHHYIKTGKSEEEIKEIINNLCKTLKIQSPRVCDGVREQFAGEVIYVLGQISVEPIEVCSFVLGDDCGDVYNQYHEWEVTFPRIPKPPPVEQTVPDANKPTFKVLHLSDTHYDPYYMEGTNAGCPEPLCCRLANGNATSSAKAAGKWGDYRKCDTPKITIQNMLEHIRTTHHDIDYIFLTGDLPPHDVWNQTRQENINIMKETIEYIMEMFPNIPVFPALGNHESSPVNSFPSPYVNNTNYSIAWLYDAVESEWLKWLPTSVSNTLRRGAFYSVLIRPGFRLLSLNMNYCNNLNWWLLLNSTDPATELQWLIYELQSAECKGEKVHIIGHIPPGHSDCLKVWSRNYNDIINRYENTIKAQFFGHTHVDEFEVFYDKDNLSRAINVAYIGPSVSPYYDLNPGYRIYYIDGDHKETTRAVVDHESWIMNLREANANKYPKWFKLYSARQAFGMTALRPSDWDLLIDKMANDAKIFDLFYKYYNKDSPVRPPCDTRCKKRILCDLKSGRSHAKKILCKSIESATDASKVIGWIEWTYNTICSLLSTLWAIPSYTIKLLRSITSL